MLARLAVAMLAVALSTPVSGVEPTSDVQVRVDSERREVVLTVGPIRIPEATPYSHHSESHLRFRWPVRGWARGYRFELFDAAGRALPRELLHHAGVANLERRQLPYPFVERLFAVGRETGPVMLPASMGVPMAPDQQLVFYYALVNATASPIDGVMLRLSIAFTPEGAGRPRSVFPFKRRGLRLAVNRRYRVVGVYDNPTSVTIPGGAMAFMAGPFIPDDERRWPAIDGTDPAFRQDLAGLLGEGAHAEHAHDKPAARR